MALTTCPDCLRDVSESAPACPHCGRPSGGLPANRNSQPANPCPRCGTGCETHTASSSATMGGVFAAALFLGSCAVGFAFWPAWIGCIVALMIGAMTKRESSYLWCPRCRGRVGSLKVPH